jgi:hypothetical protein
MTIVSEDLVMFGDWDQESDLEDDFSSNVGSEDVFEPCTPILESSGEYIVKR